jgi:hypothetical protein
MALKYGDAVVFVKKSPDGSLRRVNAIVLNSTSHAPRSLDGKLIKDAADEEHLDLAVPKFYPDGHPVKTRVLDSVFENAADQRPWKDGLWCGWEANWNSSLRAEIAAYDQGPSEAPAQSE